jgi:tetrahydromethanopterin S-methyltransferase subunit F
MGKLARANRRLARGTDEATPARALFAVGTVVAILVVVVMLAAVLLWVFLG